jgi:mannose-6-phosphate isomerase
VECPYFTTDLLEEEKGKEILFSQKDSFSIYIGLEGSATLTDNNGYFLEIKQGETVLVPAEIQSVSLHFNENSKLLKTYIG